MPVSPSNDAASFVIRSMEGADEPAWMRFIAEVPEGERRFLKDDLGSPRQGSPQPGSPQARRLLAVDADGHVVGVAGAFPGEGWSSHVAEVRVLVSSRHRRHGLGRLLARAALKEALEMACTHAFVEVVAEQEALVEMFQDLGFEPEALLADFVRDSDGHFHDLMLLTHRAGEQWSRHKMLGLSAVAG